MEEKKRFDKRETLKLLREIDEKLAKVGYQRKFKLYCIGGTKMILSGLRESSEDVDFYMDRNTYRVLSGYVAELELRGIRFDTFEEGKFPGYRYEGIEHNAKRTRDYGFKHFELYLMDDVDFLLTKALALRAKDRRDIEVIFSRRSIPKEKILERFKRVRFDSDKESELRRKFELFLKEYFREED